MGVDFTATLDHRLTWEELYSLPDRLNARWVLPGALAHWVALHVHRAGPSWNWRVSPGYSSIPEELFQEGYVRLDGTDGFHLTVYKTTLELMHLARWGSFLSDPEVQLGLHEATRLIASAARSTVILFLPDSGLAAAAASDLLFEGGTVHDMADWLAAHVGPPLASPAEFLGREARDWDENAYFLERIGETG